MSRHALRSRQETPMPYRIAGIDVHKRMLAVVVADVEIEGELQFEHRKVGTSPSELRALAEWLLEGEVGRDKGTGGGHAHQRPSYAVRRIHDDAVRPPRPALT